MQMYANYEDRTSFQGKGNVKRLENKVGESLQGCYVMEN
jgi:hypothetical protein